MRIVAALFALGMPTAVLAADAPIPLTARPESSKVGGQPVVIAIEAPNLDAGDLRCASSVGKTLGPIAVAPGRHACRLTPPPSGPSQVAIIVVYSDRMDGPIAATFVPIAGRGGGDYPRALLFTRPAVIPADGVSQAQVNLFSLDRMGAPFGAEFSRVVTSAGKLAPLRAAGVGRAVAMLTAPSAGDGVDLEARLADGGNKVNARARITLTAAPPTRVEIGRAHV